MIMEVITQAMVTVEGPAHRRTETQAPGNEMVFAYGGAQKASGCFFATQFSLPVHSASISPSWNMLCILSRIYWNLNLLHC